MVKKKATDAAATWEDIDSVFPWERNPRNNEEAVDEVAQSIQRFGFGAPLVVRLATRTIIAGHTRYKAAKKLGHTRVPVRFLDLSEQEAEALALADNKLGELADWDEGMLHGLLKDLASQQVEVTGLGWDNDELSKILMGGNTPPAPSSSSREPLPLLPGSVHLHQGDSAVVLESFADNIMDSCVCDPPYGLSNEADPREVLKCWLAGEKYVHNQAGFMGKEWDSFVPGPELWSQVFRVLKPGAHVVAFASERTVDWMMLALRLVGFEIRDCGHWCYWSGFPKSMDLGKEDLDPLLWRGWGTALKPAVEPWILARKPLEGTLVENIRQWGTGGLNIEGCGFREGDPMWPGPNGPILSSLASSMPDKRFPANLILCNKPTKEEREAGCGHLEIRVPPAKEKRKSGSAGLRNPRAGAGRTRSWGNDQGGHLSKDGLHNDHPTLKPIRLMAWLTKLVTPYRGRVLDPFMGSGTEGCAAVPQGFQYDGIELDPHFVEVSEARIAHWSKVGLESLGIMVPTEDTDTADVA